MRLSQIVLSEEPLFPLENQLSFATAFISHPLDNQNLSFGFSSRHSEFVQIKGELLAPPQTASIAIRYPDGAYQYLLLDGASARGLTPID